MDANSPNLVKNAEKKKLDEKEASEPSGTDERVEALLKEAQDFEDQYNFPEALRKANEAIAINASSVDALLMAASATVSMGDCDEEAKILYQKAIDLEPNTGYDKYFGLAQLVKNNESIDLYNKGLKIIKTEFEMLKKEHTDLLLDPRSNIMKDKLIESFLEDSNKFCLKISSIYASMVEVYLCDLSNEEGSLEEALRLLKEGLKQNSESSELWMLLTSILVSTNQVFVFKNVSYDAFNSAKLMIKYLLIRSKTADVPEDSLIDNLEKAAQLCMTLKQFRLAKLALEEFKLWLGSDSSKVLGNYALMHRMRADFHLAGAHHYANLAIDFINGREKACEVEEEDVAYKKFCEDLLKSTPTKLAILEEVHFNNGENDDETEGRKKENGISEPKASTSNESLKDLQSTNEDDKEENDELFEESDIDESEGCRDFEENERYGGDDISRQSSRTSIQSHCSTCECGRKIGGKRRVRSDSDSSSQDSNPKRRPRLGDILEDSEDPESSDVEAYDEQLGEDLGDSDSGGGDEVDNTIVEANKNKSEDKIQTKESDDDDEGE